MPSRAIFVAPFDELAQPRVLAHLASRAEERGWDGFFLWDHMLHAAPVRALLDPWVVLGAIALATERLRLGPMVTPLSRRRIHKVARETATLDLLSGGRLTFGVGLGTDNYGELSSFGEVEDARERARLLDAGLERLQDYWAGEFEPRPLQQPRIPIWAAANWPNRRPLRRAARLDGLFPVQVPDPDALREMIDETLAQRPTDEDPARPFDVAIMYAPGSDPTIWEDAGATWALTGFDNSPKLADVRAVIDAGP